MEDQAALRRWQAQQAAALGAPWAAALAVPQHSSALPAGSVFLPTVPIAPQVVEVATNRESNKPYSAPTSRGRKRPWRECEDITIMSLVRRFGAQWPRIASLLEGRTADAVRNRWHRLQKAHNAIDTDEGRAAMLVSSGMDVDMLGGGGFAPGDAEKYGLLVQPPPPLPDFCAGGVGADGADGADGSTRSAWTKAEDEILIRGVEVHGFKWRAIVAELPGRTDSSTRNRWNRLQKERAAGGGSAEEGEKGERKDGKRGGKRGEGAPASRTGEGAATGDHASKRRAGRRNGKDGRGCHAATATGEAEELPASAATASSTSPSSTAQPGDSFSGSHSAWSSPTDASSPIETQAAAGLDLGDGLADDLTGLQDGFWDMNREVMSFVGDEHDETRPGLEIGEMDVLGAGHVGAARAGHSGYPSHTSSTTALSGSSGAGRSSGGSSSVSPTQPPAPTHGFGPPPARHPACPAAAAAGSGSGSTAEPLPQFSQAVSIPAGVQTALRPASVPASHGFGSGAAPALAPFPSCQPLATMTAALPAPSPAALCPFPSSGVSAASAAPPCSDAHSSFASTFPGIAFASTPPNASPIISSSDLDACMRACDPLALDYFVSGVVRDLDERGANLDEGDADLDERDYLPPELPAQAPLAPARVPTMPTRRERKQRVAPTHPRAVASAYAGPPPPTPPLSPPAPLPQWGGAGGVADEALAPAQTRDDAIDELMRTTESPPGHTARIHPVWLRFVDPKLQARYDDMLADIRHTSVRWVCLLCVATSVSMGGLVSINRFGAEFYSEREYWATMWHEPMAVAVEVGFLGLTYSKTSRHYTVAMLRAIFMLAYVGIWINILQATRRCPHDPHAVCSLPTAAVIADHKLRSGIEWLSSATMLLPLMFVAVFRIPFGCVALGQLVNLLVVLYLTFDPTLYLADPDAYGPASASGLANATAAGLSGGATKPLGWASDLPVQVAMFLELPVLRAVLQRVRASPAPTPRPPAVPNAPPPPPRALSVRPPPPQVMPHFLMTCSVWIVIHTQLNLFAMVDQQARRVKAVEKVIVTIRNTN